MAEVTRLRLLIQCMDSERKTAMALCQMAEKRELPALIERAERAAETLRRRGRRMAQDGETH
jgi:hypothetical protein